MSVYDALNTPLPIILGHSSTCIGTCRSWNCSMFFLIGIVPYNGVSGGRRERTMDLLLIYVSTILFWNPSTRNVHRVFEAFVDTVECGPQTSSPLN